MKDLYPGFPLGAQSSVCDVSSSNYSLWRLYGRSGYPQGSGGCPRDHPIDSWGQDYTSEIEP